MFPVLFDIGGFKVHSFGVLMVVAFFVGVWMARKRAPRYGLSPDEMSDVAFWALIAGVLGARIVFILTELPYYLKNPQQLLSLQFQGLTSFGGLIFGAGAALLWCKLKGRPVAALVDTLAPPLLLAHAIGRIGCLLNGCCYGGECDLAWGVHVEGQEGLFHPAQAYDAIMNVAAMALLLRVEAARRLAPGQVAALFFVLHGAARFVYEFWRAGTTSEFLGPLPITMAQAMALTLVFFGLLLYAWLGRRRVEVPAA